MLLGLALLAESTTPNSAISAISASLPWCRASEALAHGFNANWVQITRTQQGRYRVIFRYTHVEVGEFREAHVDFDAKEDAIKVYQDLAQGADFFIGDVKKSIHFHKPPQRNAPY